MDAQPARPVRPPAAWRGAELFGRPDWELRLEAREVEELALAVRSSRHVPCESLTRVHVPLPRLGPRLARLQETLETESGATLVRGLDLERLAAAGTGARIEDALARAFQGLAVHLGTPVSQSAAGERLLPVRDEGHAPDDARVRGPNTNRRLSFHTDRCDVIAFLCVRPALAGGETHLVSSIALRDELARRHPRALELLRGPFPYLRHTVDGGNERPYVELPVFSEHEGHFAASFLRVLIDRAHAHPGAPSLGAEQIAALDTLEAVADEPGMYARLRLDAGDLLLVNNWVVLHRRTAFEDHAEDERRRLLLRLWLSVPNSRPLAPCFADHFGATAAGALRGGMRASGPTSPGPRA